MTYPDYEGVEAGAFTPVQLDRYRAMLLRKTAPQSNFIAGLMARPFSAVELCCGNGRLLIDLSRQGLLSRGVGIDIAQSRIDFGHQWVLDLGLSNVELLQGDVLSHAPSGQFDVAVCITGAAQYFPRVELPNLLALMLTAAPICVLELYTIPATRAAMLAMNGGQLKTWDVLPPDDPFAYYMDNYVYDAEECTMLHEKVFIHRSGRIDDGRSERLHYYTSPEITYMLYAAGCCWVDTYVGWGAAGSDQISDQIIVVGRKESATTT